MIVPTGSRDLHFPGSHFNRDGEQGRPILAHLDEAFTEPVVPSLDDPTDETWMRLDPVPVSEADFALPIIYSTTIPEDVLNERMRWPLTDRRWRPMQPGDFVHTIGPFKSERFVRAVRAHQHRRMSLTLAGERDGAPVLGRWFDVELSLDVDLKLLRGPAFWLDFLAHPVGGDSTTACLVHRPLERTA